MNHGRIFLAASMAVTAFGGLFGPGLGTAARAQEKYAGVTLSPAAAVYLILADVNIRAKPLTKSKRVGRFRKGARVAVAGRAKGTEWLAVKRGGKIIGFVFSRVMAAIIDGRLSADLTGRATGPGGQVCQYTVRFEGKNKAPDEALVTSDYTVRFRCRWKPKKPFAFEGSMFITEIPYRTGVNEVYQINVDIPQSSGSIELPFSVIVMYHRRKNRIVFDSLPEAGLISAKPAKSKPAKSVVAALTGAVEIAISAWGPKVWRELSKK